MDWTLAACQTHDPELSDLPVRIAKRLVEVIDEYGAHWLWQGSTNNDGYGRVWAKYPREPTKTGDKRPVHVVVWEELVGLVPVGFELDHTCAYKTCAHPLCMEVVTHAENQRRMGFRQTHCRRAGHPRIPANNYRDPTTGRARCRRCMAEREARRPPRTRRRVAS